MSPEQQYNTQEFKIGRIRGTRYSPTLLKNDSLVIISHGFGNTRRDEKIGIFRDILASHGFTVVSFDFYGGSNESESGGKTTEMSVLTELEDLRSLVKAFRDEFPSIYLIGISQGGLVSAMLAAEENFDGLALIYPALVIPDFARETFPEREFPEQTEVLGIQVSSIYFKSIYDLDLWKTIDQIKSPVLLFHGEKDTLVPNYYSVIADRMLENSLLISLPDVGHGLDTEQATLVGDSILSFFSALNMERK